MRSEKNGIIWSVTQLDVDIRGVAFSAKKTWVCNGCCEDIYDEVWCNTCRRKICQRCVCGSEPYRPKKARICTHGLEIPLVLDKCDYEERISQKSAMALSLRRKCEGLSWPQPGTCGIAMKVTREPVGRECPPQHD